MQQLRSGISDVAQALQTLGAAPRFRQVKEWSTSPEDYRSAMYRLLSQGMNEHLAYGKKVTLISPDSARLPHHAAKMLTDGVRGSHDYAYNWLVFAGQDLEAVVDLETINEVKRIESAYYQYLTGCACSPKLLNISFRKTARILLPLAGSKIRCR